MTTSHTPIELLAIVIAELERARCRYALLHDDGIPPLDRSDVDLVLDRNPNEVVLPILRRVERTSDARLVQCLHHDVPHAYYYVLATGRAPVRFLHLDCLCDPAGLHRYRVPTGRLVANAVPGAWGMRAHPADLALYLLLKKALKGDTSAAAISRLRLALAHQHAAIAPAIDEWVGSAGRGLVSKLCDPATDATEILATLRSNITRRALLRHPLRRLRALSLDGWRKFGRLRHPTGLFVVLLGPDGAGKSTVADRIAAKGLRAFRALWRFHWRPGVLPKLRRAPVGGAAGAPPPARSAYRGATSLARFTYYWIDFVVGYGLRLLPRRARTTLVIGERYFADVVVNPARYGFDVPAALAQLASRFVARPDLTVLLHGEPLAIHRRKPELPVEAIEAQLRAYRSELGRWGKVAEIATDTDADAVSDDVAARILEETRLRTLRRLRSCGQLRTWRAFPRAQRTRVWVENHDQLSGALDLWLPYARVARCVKALIGVAPRACQAVALGEPADAATTDALDALTDRITQRLGDDRLVVSFATGTPGADRKTTARASRDGRPVAYVKIGAGAAAAARLRNEAEMLRAMPPVLGDAATLPELLAFDDGDVPLLYVGALQGRRRPRPLAPDRFDLAVLHRLARHEPRREDVGEWIAHNVVVDRREAADGTDAAWSTRVQDIGELLRRSLGDAGLELVATHGDYAPWNTLGRVAGGLHVLDWEYGERAAPALGDLFHRILMPARLVRGMGASDIVGRLLRVADDRQLRPLIAQSRIAPAQVPAYLVLYLMRMKLRSVDDRASARFFLDALDQAVAAANTSPTRRNVLVSAYACEPERGSEPGVGWNMCQAISRDHDAWVVTRRNNRDAIEQALRAAPNPHLHFCYADAPAWLTFWKRGQRGIRLYYYLWQFCAWREARRLMRTVRFDLGHHVTFVNDYLFTFLALLPLPFVWGPIGSHPPMPRTLLSGRAATAKDRARQLLRCVARCVDPLYWLSARRARLIVGIDATLAARFPVSTIAKHKVIEHAAIGVEPTATITRIGGEGGIRIVSAGRLVPMKGFELVIRAFARLVSNDPRNVLEIIGDGPERRRLEALSASLGIASHVTFSGWLHRSAALEHIARGDVFLYPSCEGGGMVVLEALMRGLPIVCLDVGGPARMVDERCAFVVPASDAATTVREIADRLSSLAADPALRRRMSRAARERAEDHTWSARHDAVRRWYDLALEGPPVHEHAASLSHG